MNIQTPEDLFKQPNLNQIILTAMTLSPEEPWHITSTTANSLTLESDTLIITISTTATA